MNDLDDPGSDKIDGRLELLADQALQGLTPEQQAELDALEVDPAELLGLELAIASVLAAGTEPLPLPRRLRQAIEADASLDNPQRSPLRRPWRAPWLSWAVAASALGFAILKPPAPKPVVPEAPMPPTLAERVEQAKGRFGSLRLAATPHPLARGAGGDLVWDPSSQQGFLRLEGLAEVEPNQGAYQLWIFDRTRDARYPVDGGLFIITDARTPTVVPIHPAIPVRDPSLFAITLEPAGGVVVSDRKRILLSAEAKKK
jgi:hypothetical protein